MSLTELLRPIRNFIGGIALATAVGCGGGNDNSEYRNFAPRLHEEIPVQYVNEGETLRLDLGRFVRDPDGDPLTYTLNSHLGRLNGSLFTFDAGEDFDGLDEEFTIPFEVTDGEAYLDTAFIVRVRDNDVVGSYFPVPFSDVRLSSGYVASEFNGAESIDSIDLALGSNDEPVIAYNHLGVLQFARRVNNRGTEWVGDIIVPDVSRHFALSVDRLGSSLSDILVVANQSGPSDGNRLYVTAMNAESREDFLVDERNGSGVFPDVTLSPAGNVGVSYLLRNSQDVNFAVIGEAPRFVGRYNRLTDTAVAFDNGFIVGYVEDSPNLATPTNVGVGRERIDRDFGGNSLELHTNGGLVAIYHNANSIRSATNRGNEWWIDTLYTGVFNAGIDSAVDSFGDRYVVFTGPTDQPVVDGLHLLYETNNGMNVLEISNGQELDNDRYRDIAVVAGRNALVIGASLSGGNIRAITIPYASLPR